MPRKLGHSVIVITGAASGIGLATAYAAANRGAAVVLAGRNAAAVRAVTAECREWGAQALAVPTDVRDEAAVRRLALRAIEAFGRIDVWVNNAAVTAFGRIEDLPAEVFHRVIETNLFGYLHGIRAALPLMREQGSGVVVNVSSGVVDVPQPYTSAYVASKHAIRALSECVRMELLLEGNPKLQLCTVYPASIDTPLFQRGANYAGRAVRPMPPVYEPEQVAAAILELAENPRREATVGAPRRLVTLLRMAAPDLFEREAATRMHQDHFQDRPAPPNDGSVFQPVSDRPELRGGWEGRPHNIPSLAPLALLAAAAAGAGYAAWRWRGGARIARARI